MSREPGDFLRALPAVDLLLEEVKKRVEPEFDPSLLVRLCRRRLESIRRSLLAGQLPGPEGMPDVATLAGHVVRDLEDWQRPRMSRVVNGTGIILHSGLGRAVYPARALADVGRASGYVLLEVDREEGARRKRDAFCEELLCELTGAEAALVVNNNAAATMIILNTLAAGREVVVSRSQLIEIGGSYRLPDVFVASGCRLREVGTTNKSRPSDYREAISPETGALMLVHTSNYRIVGFTKHVGLDEMIAIGRESGLPVIHDVGSGSLIDLEPFGVLDEPPVADSIKAGADVVCFSGDKLIGGPQAGIIIGKRAVVERIRKNPLARALRIDKNTCLALESVLKLYFEPARLAERIPTLAMLTESCASVRARALALQERIATTFADLRTELVEDTSELGAGTLPTHGIATVCLALSFPGSHPSRAARRLRLAPVPVFSRLKEDRVLLDLRTMTRDDFDDTLAAIARVMEDGENG
ncbi:MAG: L-seryl-tRNA(Sec) selenium transferase [Planctomycetes bacterium]|nr:L-seryl-tRNA(Sec) selenium transferase [Planctomycetota bacterium]